MQTGLTKPKQHHLNSPLHFVPPIATISCLLYAPSRCSREM